MVNLSVGSLNGNDSNSNENVTWKYTFEKWRLFCDYCFFLTSVIVDRTCCKWTGRSAVEANIENERLRLKTLNLEISCCHLADYFYVKDLCGPHVQHDYFSSLKQSNNRFVALQLPPSLLKLFKCSTLCWAAGDMRELSQGNSDYYLDFTQL